jgi:hypothetical protein
MRSYEFRKYIDLINEATDPEAFAKLAPPRDKITYADKIAGATKHKPVEEKWDTATQVDPREKGKYTGKTKAELLKSYNALKASGPHKKGSKEYSRMHELAFAIRAKSGWERVKEDHLEDPHSILEKAPPGMEDLVLKLKKEYPGEPAKAFATAWSIYNKKHGK